MKQIKITQKKGIVLSINYNNNTKFITKSFMLKSDFHKKRIIRNLKSNSEIITNHNGIFSRQILSDGIRRNNNYHNFKDGLYKHEFNNKLWVGMKISHKKVENLKAYFRVQNITLIIN